MRQHYTLGLACGSRSVDQSGKIFGFDRAHERIKHGIAVGAMFVGTGENFCESLWRLRELPLESMMRIRCREVCGENGVQLLKLLAR